MLEGYWRSLRPPEAGLLLFLLGLAVGSFCNVIRCRVPAGRSVVAPRSHCPACRHELGPLDLVPILSFVWLRGRCRHCETPFGCGYPLVEFACGVLAALAGYAGGFSAGVAVLAMCVATVWAYASVRRFKGSEVGSALIEVVLAVGLLGAVAIPMLDFGANMRGATPFQRQIAVSLASSKVEELANDAWRKPSFPNSNSDTLGVGAYLFDLEWTVSPYSPPSGNDYPNENEKLRHAVVRVTCQNCTRPMPAVRVVALLAKP